MTDLRWATVTPVFGARMPHGSCNAIVRDTVCGFPRHPDGTCSNGHPAQPTGRRAS